MMQDMDDESILKEDDANDEDYIVRREQRDAALERNVKRVIGATCYCGGQLPLSLPGLFSGTFRR